MPKLKEEQTKKSTPARQRVEAGLVEEDFELQPREDTAEFDMEAQEEAQREAIAAGAPHAGVVSLAQSSQQNPNVSEEEQGMEMTPVIVGPPAYGSPDPSTSQGRLMPLEQHPLNVENLPEGHPAAISPDYGEGYDVTLSGVETTRSQPLMATVNEDQQAAANAEVNATSGARELANSSGVDLAQVEGTGEDGRVTKADVEAYLAEQETA
jgi:pyruvate/2-oxoglutarate dehydrogenase complex dihydrolipoamide acyltransferase (E2) component